MIDHDPGRFIDLAWFAVQPDDVDVDDAWHAEARRADAEDAAAVLEDEVRDDDE